MEARPGERSSRIGPVIWGTILVVLVAALGISFLLSRQALSDAKAAAEARVEEYADAVLRPALTPEATAADITGASYRALVSRVQEGILSDDRVVRVRIWKPSGDLIFSTDQRDAVDSVVAEDDVRIQQAAADQTVSTVTESVVPSADGLAGTDEQLLETFVPLHLLNEPSTSGVVEIDHRYVLIEDEVARVWRPTQIGLAIALGMSVLLLGVSLRGRRGVEPARTGATPRRAPTPAGSQPEGGGLREATERTDAAERAAREAERKLAEAERKLAVAEKRIGDAENVGTAVSASVAKRVEELEQRLRAEAAELEEAQGEVQRLRSVLTRREAELEQAGSEVQRLVSSLSKKETELAAARTGMQDVEAATARSKDEAAAAAARVAQAEQTATQAEEAAAAAREAAAELERRALVAEERLGEVEGRATEAARMAVELEARARAAEEAAAAASQVATDEQGAEVLSGLQAEVGGLRNELDAASTQLDEARRQLQGKDEELATLAREVERLSTVSAADGEPTEDGSRVAELETRVRELEDQRRTDVSELQRAQEMLANTQVELAEATRRLKAMERSAVEAERLEVVAEEATSGRAGRRAARHEEVATRAGESKVEGAPGPGTAGGGGQRRGALGRTGGRE